MFVYKTVYTMKLGISAIRMLSAGEKNKHIKRMMFRQLPGKNFRAPQPSLPSPPKQDWASQGTRRGAFELPMPFAMLRWQLWRRKKDIRTDCHRL